MELTKATTSSSEVTATKQIVQLRSVKGDSVFLTDPEGNKIEFRTALDGTRITITNDEHGSPVGIEERANGTIVYHVASDCTGLPSSHEVRADETQVVYFYNAEGSLQHFVEIKPNGDRISTILSKNGTMYSMEQKQVGGIIFKAWVNAKNEVKEGLVWLQQDGSITTYGDNVVVKDICLKFSKSLDGIEI